MDKAVGNLCTGVPVNEAIVEGDKFFGKDAI